MRTGSFQLPRRRRARVAVVLAAVMTTGLLGLTQMWPAIAAGGQADRPVDRDINAYVVFAFDNLTFKGATPDYNDVDMNNNGLTGIHGGNIGLNKPGGTLNMCANFITHMDDGSQAVGDTLHGSSDCHLYDVYANAMTGNPPIVPRNSGPNNVPPVVFPILTPDKIPAFPQFTCDPTHADVVVQAGPAVPLPPGVYGSVEVTQDGILNLDGDYTFCSFVNGTDVTINTTAATVVKIVGQVQGERPQHGPGFVRHAVLHRVGRRRFRRELRAPDHGVRPLLRAVRGDQPR